MRTVHYSCPILVACSMVLSLYTHTLDNASLKESINHWVSRKNVNQRRNVRRFLGEMSNSELTSADTEDDYEEESEDGTEFRKDDRASGEGITSSAVRIAIRPFHLLLRIGCHGAYCTTAACVHTEIYRCIIHTPFFGVFVTSLTWRILHFKKEPKASSHRENGERN